MTAALKVNAEDLLRWARHLDEIPNHTRAAVARALNDYGRGVVTTVAQTIAEQTGLSPNDVRSHIEVSEATARSLLWRMNARMAMPSAENWQRPWEKRGDGGFDKSTLVKIITSGDETTCEICEEAADRSPYTMDEINQLAAKWKHWEPEAGLGARTNLLHPNCRCTIQPWQQTRRLAVTFGAKGAPTELLNARQLGQRVADEVKVSIRAIKLL